MANPLRVEIDKTFPGGARVEIKLTVDFDEEPVQILFGPSGSGKSTFLRCIAGLEQPEQGLISLADQIWLDTRRSIARSPQARKVCYLSQRSTLFPHLNVIKNITYGLIELSSVDQAARAQEMIDLLELSGLEKRFPHQLSGGQRQRVALARAIAVKPRLLLLDEPFSAVDQPLKHLLRLKLRSLFQNLRIPVFIVTHDPVEASSLGQRVHLVDEGKLIQSELSSDIFRKPSSLRAARILGFENILLSGNMAEIFRADEVELTLGSSASVVESISEGSFVRIILATDRGLVTSMQPRSRFTAHLPQIGERFELKLPTPPRRYPL